MPNIVINNFCNQNCRYCFASKMMMSEDQKKNIDFDSFKKIVTFLKKSNVRNVGIIGGEPSLHSELITFINYLKSNNIYPRILTNGTNLLSHDITQLKNCSLLININSQEEVGVKNYESTLLTLNQLDHINTNVTYGINLFKNLSDYNYFIDLLIQHGKNSCRCSYVSPTSLSDLQSKEKYYNDGKELFLSFCADAQKYNIQVQMDCNKIPLCYFSDKEIELVNNVCKNYNSFCNPVVDINMDFTATSCFGAYDPVNIFDFEYYLDLERYLFAKKMLPKILINNDEKCKNCEKFNKLICQGGCLAFAQNKIH